MIRDSGMRAYRPTPGADPEADFREFLERELQKALPRTEFVLAVALFTYGRLDMVEHIGATAPPANTHLHALLGVLRDLLPLPKDVSGNDEQAIAQWVRDQGHRLRWDDQAGQFVESV